MTQHGKDDDLRKDIDDILGLLDSFQTAAALGAAMELGLFWILGEGVCSGDQIAGILKLPKNRCLYWLQYLSKLDLLEPTPEGYSCSRKARAAILETYSQETWAFLARESREQFPVFQFLAPHFRNPGSLWEFAGQDPPAYLDRMNEDPNRAREFTRMLFELHQGVAESLADVLNLSGVNLLMDLGGGSGVLSMALLRHNPQLRATVVDIPNVCRAGRELAEEHAMEDRLSFHPADFVHDRLPTGFDMVIECDVGVFNEQLFRKLRESLQPGGRYVIIDQFAPAERMAPLSRISWALRDSLIDPEFSYPTAHEIVSLLEQAGYRRVTCEALPRLASEPSQFMDDMYLIESQL